MLILLCLCHHSENSANKASNPKANMESILWPGWLNGVIGSTTDTELKTANMLTLSQRLLMLKGALMSCYVVQVDRSPTPITFYWPDSLQVAMLVFILYTDMCELSICLCYSHVIFCLLCMHLGGIYISKLIAIEDCLQCFQLVIYYATHPCCCALLPLQGACLRTHLDCQPNCTGYSICNVWSNLWDEFFLNGRISLSKKLKDLPHFVIITKHHLT